ncbi:probable cysteine--tRNA ligase, mitochondrial [Mya arenaria]|uniref:probable cysteine--tRNA ligase, mitochondrial n=1 Tax=Mya arenaria TaxID=6604 RepID=UPI0022E5666A|nr:probable cysteine--tRNA ligase, mitochondrial [Mya arenaria]
MNVSRNSCNLRFCSKVFTSFTIAGKKKGVTYNRFSNHYYSSKTPKVSEWIEPSGNRTGIYIYNSLTKQKNELVLPRGNHLSWYICGPTVYDSSHIGHASNYVRYDIIRRVFLDFFNINVSYLMGVTDIDDKIIVRANELGQDFTAITNHYEREFFQEMLALNILQPTMTSRVSDYVPEIIAFVQKIMEKGHGYVGKDGSVYFDVVEYGNYYKFASPQQLFKSDVEVKKNPADFALWKAAKPGEPFWDSPWGPGRPGWHIECSAMASRVFGSTIDLHSGGLDLMFPHHENEIAQSCSYHGVKQWANYWLHTGFLFTPQESEKMSKSLKNTISTSSLLSKYTSNQFRMFCMLTHYRNNIEFTEEKMQKAISLDNKIGSFLRQCDAYVKGQVVGGDISEAETMNMLAENYERVMGHLKDDFHTPLAMDAIFNLISVLNQKFKESDTVCRCPGVIAAVEVHVKRICKKLGFLKKGWKMSEDSDNMKLREVLDHTVRFRYNVRQYSIKTKLPESVTASLPAGMEKKIRKELFTPLLQQCDSLRTQLKNCYINIQDLKTSSTWDFDDSKDMREDSDWDSDSSGTPMDKQTTQETQSSEHGTSKEPISKEIMHDTQCGKTEEFEREMSTESPSIHDTQNRDYKISEEPTGRHTHDGQTTESEKLEQSLNVEDTCRKDTEKVDSKVLKEATESVSKRTTS